MSSWLSKAVHGVGHLAEKAAPYVGLIPGVGTLAGGVIGGLGGLAAGDGLSGALKYGIQGAAGGAAGGGVRSLLSGAISHATGGGSPGVQTDANGVPQVMQNGHPITISDINTNIASDGAPSSDGDSGVGGWLRKAAGSLTSGPGQTNPLMMGLAGAEGINSAYLGNKANNFANDALKTTTDSYNSRAGLRSAGIEGLLHPKAPDMTAMSTIQSRNPYSAPSSAPQPVAPPASPNPAGFLATRLRSQAA